MRLQDEIKKVERIKTEAQNLWDLLKDIEATGITPQTDCWERSIWQRESKLKATIAEWWDKVNA